MRNVKSQNKTKLNTNVYLAWRFSKVHGFGILEIMEKNEIRAVIEFYSLKSKTTTEILIAPKRSVNISGE